MLFSCVKYSAFRTSLSITNKREESINMARQILSCGKYHAETHCCLKANFRAREREKPCSSADRRNDRNPPSVLQQQGSSVRKHVLLKVTSAVESASWFSGLYYLTPSHCFGHILTRFWQHGQQSLQCFLDNSITF